MPIIIKLVVPRLLYTEEAIEEFYAIYINGNFEINNILFKLFLDQSYVRIDRQTHLGNISATE